MVGARVVVVVGARVVVVVGARVVVVVGARVVVYFTAISSSAPLYISSDLGVLIFSNNIYTALRITKYTN